MTKYLVTGASGQLGALTIDALRKFVPAENITGLVRRDDAATALSATGIDARVASYDDPAALTKAFAGIDRVLLISGSEVGQRVPQHLNVIAAAKEAGVNFMAYTSILKAADSQIGLAPEHKATEEALAASGLDFTLLRNGWYTENYLMALPQILEMGQHFGAAGDAKFAPATRADFAEAAAIVLSGAEHEGKTYELAGDEVFTYAEYAQTISDLSGKDVAYVDMPEAAYAEALKGAGLPAPMADLLANADAVSKDGWLFDDSKTLSSLLGRPTVSLRDTLRAALNS
ncbi:NAD(P)H dehydrogenase (quinone) [Pacificibacter maritimus]|uniref:NAD(P)H dehydrogenase (Quinone) n=1 Tax=Pacificibacter maritimus TaxID=762213 RepID=A0A3N4UTH6_9RHOB|nr:SDR family oxidoreductase [Pacificibacter maritimus]RPE72005.1 NAD(P)H dehydrogenase (quinone) [Pacificibacter maritimus]